jgi:hypothetical protein
MTRARDARGRFLPRRARPAGGAPDGNPEGAAEQFVTELRSNWAKHGAATIEQVRIERPHDYLRLIAANLGAIAGSGGDAGALDGLTDDEIADELRRILAELEAEGADPRA